VEAASRAREVWTNTGNPKGTRCAGGTLILAIRDLPLGHFIPAMIGGITDLPASASQVQSLYSERGWKGGHGIS
jgi:hypothetical protein